MTRKILLIGVMLVFTACSLLPQPTQPPAVVTSAPPTAVATFALPTSSTPVATATESKQLKTIRGGLLQEPNGIVPYFARTPGADRIISLIFLSLAERNDKGELVPELAETIPSIENGGISKDGLTITWKLRKDIKWSDGSPIIARDVKTTWQAIIDTRNIVNSREGYDAIESIDVPDNSTVIIKFKSLYLDWMNLFTNSPTHQGVILPELLIKGKGGLETDLDVRQPKISSGPYVLTEWKTGVSITLSANPNFYKGKPKADKIEIKFIPTPADALTALQEGTLDWYVDFTEEDIPTLQKAEKIQKKFVPLAEYEEYFFNLGTLKGVDNKGKSDLEGNCWLKDMKVRKAIFLGINREAINEKFFAGKSIVPVTPWSLSPWANTSLKLDVFDAEAAKKLLDEVGLKPGNDGVRIGKCGGKDTRMFIALEISNKKLRQNIAQMIQSDLNKIGIDMRIVPVEAQRFFGSYAEGANIMIGKYEMAGFSYPEQFAPEWRCDSVPSRDTPNGLNVSHYCDPALDKLFSDANTLDATARKKALDAIQKYMVDNYLTLMIYARLNVYGFSERFVPAPFAANDIFWNAEEWDVK